MNAAIQAQIDAARASWKPATPRKPPRAPVTPAAAREAPGGAEIGPKPARGKSATPTNALTRAVVEWLTLEKCRVWRQNNGAVFDPTRQVFRAGNSTPGLSDVLGFCQRTGRVVAVEIKTGRDKLTQAQTDFLAAVRAAGGCAIEGRSLDQIRRDFAAWRRPEAGPK